MKINDALRESRGATNKSQEYMALELGIARKTVQNWEKGVSEPTIKQALEWFRVLGISPIPYLFQVVHEDMDRISSVDEEKKLRDALKRMIEVIPEEGMRQLLFLFYGDHGSSPRAVLNMITAHLQTPMENRVSHGTLILKNYEIASQKGTTTGGKHIKPDVYYIKDAIERAQTASITNDSAYVMGNKDPFDY